ncbi:hypothetical protein G6F66_012209 [Rhizopus arrhizus]|nr:hypothetical protein G6F66_012209 [Rhizopus arrhizus]
MESTIQPFQSQYNRITMVDQSSVQQEWITNTTNRKRTTCHHNTQTMGYWTNEEKGHSINVRELLAILFAIQLHAKKYKNSSIRLYTDNMTALKFVTKTGGTSSPLLQDLAVKIQDICNQYKLKVEYHHIPGVNNIQADQLSRQRMESPLCIRVETKSPIISVLEPQTRSRSHSIGCLQSAVDNERDVLIPTLEIHSPDKHPVEKTED